MNKNPIGKQFSKIGDPRMKGGAIFVGRGKEGVIQMTEEVLKDGLRLQGIPVDKIAKKEVRKFVRRMSAQQDKRFEEMGIPENIKRLFEIRNKSELINYAKTIVIKKIDLVCFIHNRKSLRLNYQFKRREFVPEFTQPLKEDFEALKRNGVGPLSKESKKLVNKTKTLFEQRRVHICHLFFKDLEWHCIYFSFDDVKPDQNHWKYGPHIHYTNSYLTDWSRRKIWYSFDERIIRGINEIHVKYDESKEDEDVSTENPAA